MMFPIPFGEASRYQKHAAAFSTDKPDDRKSSEPPYLRDGHRRVKSFGGSSARKRGSRKADVGPTIASLIQVRLGPRPASTTDEAPRQLLNDVGAQRRLELVPTFPRSGA